jgi:hypothetical protein
MVNFNGADTYLGYSSGNLSAGNEQRWAAIPFTVGGPGWEINQVDIDYFLAAGQTPTDIHYIIWNRTGLTAPTTMATSGILGAHFVGVDDPRVPEAEDWLHSFTGLNIALTPGDYYFTAHGGPDPGQAMAWLTGGDLQDEALEQDHMWRSQTFPAPGFVVYNPPNVLPGANMADGQDRWNPSFTMFGEVVPEPGTILAIAGGLALLALRRRK